MTLKDFIKEFNYIEEELPLGIEYSDATYIEKTFKKDEFWFTPESELPFNDFNKDIIEPDDNKEYGDVNNFPKGTTTIRMDDDFWLCAVLPYEYKDLTIQELVGILWPTVENPRFNPDTQNIEAWNKIWDDCETFI